MFRGQYQSLAHKRKLRVRSRLTSRVGRPRLTIFRSNKYTYLQVINDESQTVVAAADTRTFEKDKKAVTKSAAAQMAAEAIVKQLQDKNILAISLDRGSYRYHGRVRVVAETLRAGKVQV
jgi:large subunit ribosomal protein L18